jgi:hypothetical protein
MAATPGLSNTRAVSPATKKKTMRAIVAIAKFRSERRHRSNGRVRCWGFMHILPVSVPVGVRAE